MLTHPIIARSSQEALQEAWDSWCLKAQLERSAGYSDAFKREEAARKDRVALARWNKD